MDRIKYRMTGSSLLDKFHSLKGSERKGKGQRARINSYQSLEELNRIQSTISKMPEQQVISKFEQMLEDMNLTEEKKAPLRQRSIAQKKAMLAMQFKGSIRNTIDTTTTGFIEELRRVPVLKGVERFEVVSSLRVALTSNPVSWVMDFARKQGLNSVLKCLSYSCDDWEERKSTLECVRCLRAYSNNNFGLKQLIEHRDATTLLMRCVDAPSSSTSSSSSSSSSSSCNQASLEAVKLLAALSLVPPAGLAKVLEAASICGEMRDRPRFAPVVRGLSSPDLQMKLACLQLINAVISTPDHLDFRLHLRNEIFRTGLNDVISSLEGHGSEEVQRQVRVLLEQKEEDAEEFSQRYDSIRFHMHDARECFELLYRSTLNTPSEDFFVSILQHLLSIREDLHARPQYYKLIEECVSQIVLHRSGVDPDFRCSRRFQLDVEPLLERMREEGGGEEGGEVEGSSRQLKGRLDEAVMARQELEARSTALQEKVAAYEAEIMELRSRLNIDIGTAITSVIKVPPPPPIADLSIPLAPPLPGLGPPGAPPPPPLAMMPPARVPSFVRPKKKYQPCNQMKRANWTKINLGQLKKESFWSEANEQKYADERLFELLANDFAFKNIEKQEQEEGAKQYRKAKELKVLDAKAAQNLSILLGSLKLPFEEIKDRILRMEDLSASFLEQLIRLLPSQDVLNKLASLKHQYESLTEPEQFGVVISSVRRLLPRISSMLFHMRFNEVVAETKPEIVAVTEAMEEVVGSQRLQELLQIILLVGNFMNAGTRNECTVGFELSFMSKIVNTKSRDNSKHLVHFLVEYLQSSHPHLLSFPQDLIHLEQASKVSLDSLAKTIGGLRTGVRQLETDLRNASNDKQPAMPADAFVRVMTLACCKTQVELLEGMHRAMVAKYAGKVASFFCIEAAKYPLDEFIGDVKLFVDHFQQSRGEIERRREVEEMQKKQKEAEERWKEERKMKRMRKKMIVDMHADDDQEGVMDNLLQALESGSAFHMANRPARKRLARVAGAERRVLLEHQRSRQSILSPLVPHPSPLATHPSTPATHPPHPTKASTNTKPSSTHFSTTKASPKLNTSSTTPNHRKQQSKTNQSPHQTTHHDQNIKSPTTNKMPPTTSSTAKKYSPLHTRISPKQQHKTTQQQHKTTQQQQLNTTQQQLQHNTTQQQQHNTTQQQLQQQQRKTRSPANSKKDSKMKTITFHDEEDDDDQNNNNNNNENINMYSVVEGSHGNKRKLNVAKTTNNNNIRNKEDKSKNTKTLQNPSPSSSPSASSSSAPSSRLPGNNEDLLAAYRPGKMADFEDLLSQLRAL